MHDIPLMQKWLAAMQQQQPDWTPTEQASLCSEHFTDDSFHQVESSLCNKHFTDDSFHLVESALCSKHYHRQQFSRDLLYFYTIVTIVVFCNAVDRIAQEI